MVNVTIEQLSPASAVDGSEKLYLSQAGVSKYLSVSAMRDFVYSVAQNRNTFLAGPVTGSASIPGYRSIALGDISSILTSGNITGLSASATIDATNATNITSGTLNLARLPTQVGTGSIVLQSYADAAIQGFTAKPTANLATAAALAANTYANGTLGLGATLTANANGALTVDGVVVAVGNIILVKNEVAASHNGLYVVTAAGSAIALYVLTRHVDMDVAAEIPQAFIVVEFGTANSNSLWLCNPSGAVTVGTTSIPFVQLNGATALIVGNGITISGNTISISVGYTGQSSIVTLGPATLPGGTLTGTTTLPASGLIGSSGKLSVGPGRASDAWGGTFMPIQFGPNSVIVDAVGFTGFGRNWYNDGTNDRYSNLAGPATKYTQNSGAHAWFYAPTGAVGGIITFVQAMQTSATTGALLINTATDDGVNKLQVAGGIKATSLTVTGAARVLANGTAVTIPNNTATTITAWSTIFDANSNFVASTGIFTAPATGFYMVSGGITFTTSIASGTVISLGIIANGIARATGVTLVGATGGFNSTSVSGLVSLTAGQTIVLQVNQSSGATQTLANNSDCYFSVAQMP